MANKCYEFYDLTTVYCIRCGKYTTISEVRYRKFNKYSCGDCNGRLAMFPFEQTDALRPSDEELEAAQR